MTISCWRLARHHRSSRASSAAVAASWSSASGHCPSPAVRAASTAPTGGIQRSTAAKGASGPRSAPFSPALPKTLCEPRLAICASSAKSRPPKTAKSLPRRLESSRALPAATARESVTTVSTASGTPTAPATAEAAPCAPDSAAPVSSTRLISGPGPSSAASTEPRSSGPGRSGSMVSRVGSELSSLVKRNSGIAAQARVSAPARTTPASPAAPCSTWSWRIVSSRAMPVANSRPTVAPST